jgi:hypothetical protein
MKDSEMGFPIPMRQDRPRRIDTYLDYFGDRPTPSGAQMLSHDFYPAGPLWSDRAHDAVSPTAMKIPSGSME